MPSTRIAFYMGMIYVVLIALTCFILSQIQDMEKEEKLVLKEHSSMARHLP